MSFVLKMSNGRGHVEWYSGLSMRTQALDKDEARRFPTAEAAEETAAFCRRNGSAFSGAFYDEGRGCYTIETVVEPA